MMRVSIFGTGYVGLVTGACLAEAGNHVICMDVDEEKINGLKHCQVPIFEPGLEALVREGVKSHRLRFTTQAADAVRHGEYIFIAVGTPEDEDGSADLTHVLDVARKVGEFIHDYQIVVDKSTVPVGTADRVREAIQAEIDRRNIKVDFSVVSNPEFLKEGAAVEDCLKPDRIILGTDDERALERMKELYAPFNRNHEKVMAMDLRSAELTKYAANAMLATKISFMNEMANLSERVGADIELVRRGIGSDPRIGFSFIYPGAGYGGSCFPKDVKALERTGRVHGYESRILKAVESVNQDQKSVLLSKIRTHFGGNLSDRVFALWGLSFKPNTDDMREASSRVLMEGLWAEGARVRAYDPEAMEEAARIYGERDDLALCESAEETLRDADALVVVTEWKSFWSPDFEGIKNTLKQAVIFDGRNIYDPMALKTMGIDYYGIGRGLSVRKI